MLRLVDPRNHNTPTHHIDLVDAARRLAKTPIRGQRLIEQLDQQGTVYAGVANQHDRLVNMSIESEPKRVRGPGNEILQRFTVRETNQMRGGEPCCEKLRIGFLDFLIAPELPCAIIDIIKVIDDLCFDATRSGDRSSGLDASLHGAGIDLHRLPCGRDTPRNGLSFGNSAMGQRQLGATAKAFWFDAFDMTMSDQENFRQCPSLILSGCRI
jgi:hypothetical protein